MADGGPAAVITNMAVMGFDADTKEMYLDGYFPGISAQEIQANMAFDVDLSRAKEVSPPSEEELRILREVCDPQRLILG